MGQIPIPHFILGQISTSGLGQISTSGLGQIPTSGLGQIPTPHFILGQIPTSGLGQIPRPLSSIVMADASYMLVLRVQVCWANNSGPLRPSVGGDGPLLVYVYCN